MTKQRRVVCAALRGDGRNDFILGLRHYSQDMVTQIDLRFDSNDFYCLSGDNQGFVDNFGKYMTRKEAYQVALAANQIIYPEACTNEELYSEGLY